MLELLNQYKQTVQEYKPLLLNFANPPDSIPNLESTISNNDLLVDCLTKVYEGKNAKYLPDSITSTVSSFLKRIIDTILLFVKDPQNQTHFTTILQEMDKLYACCLQYGLITFGFSSQGSVVAG